MVMKGIKRGKNNDKENRKRDIPYAIKEKERVVMSRTPI